MLPRPSILLTLLCAAFPLSRVSAKEDDFVEGEVIVTFKPAVADETAKSTLQRHSLGMTRHYAGLSRSRRQMSGMVREKSRTTAALIKELKDDSSVESVEPNYLRHVSASAVVDPDFSKLWALSNTGQTVNAANGISGADIKYLSAWKLAKPSTGDIVIAVADTGVDITHPDLAPNIWVNPKEIPGNGIDDDNDGYIDDVNGYDFAENTAVITDSGFHGTHVAGTMAAAGHNGLGIIGVEPNAKILPLKVSSDGDSMSTSALLDAFDYLVTLKEQGVNIVALNASYGGGSNTNAERKAVEALNSAGILLCAAAGNDGTNNDTSPSYPASYTTANVISVAALTQTGGLASFSNYGATSVDLAAPGENIYSTEPLSLATVSSVTVGGITYAATPLEYAPTTPLAGVTGTVYDCGIGNPTEFPDTVNGNIALIQRGTLNFSVKVTNAKNAGAIAAIIYDNSADTTAAGTWTLGGAGDWIPSFQTTQAIGKAILAKLPASGTVVNAPDPKAAYQYLDGTSMAAPHVTGAVAFAALNFPNDTMAQRKARILNSVTKVASLTSKMTSGGYLNLLKIVDSDSDQLPDWLENTLPAGLNSTPQDDPDGDGFNNEMEFLSGTDPSVPGSHPGFSDFSAGNSSSPNDSVLSFQTVSDLSYQVQYSDSLEDNSWKDLGSPVIGTGEVLKVTDSGALTASNRRFYRLHLILP